MLFVADTITRPPQDPELAALLAELHGLDMTSLIPRPPSSAAPTPRSVAGPGGRDGRCARRSRASAGRRHLISGEVATMLSSSATASCWRTPRSTAGLCVGVVGGGRPGASARHSRADGASTLEGVAFALHRLNQQPGVETSPLAAAD